MPGSVAPAPTWVAATSPRPDHDRGAGEQPDAVGGLPTEGPGDLGRRADPRQQLPGGSRGLAQADGLQARAAVSYSRVAEAPA